MSYAMYTKTILTLATLMLTIHKHTPNLFSNICGKAFTP